MIKLVRNVSIATRILATFVLLILMAGIVSLVAFNGFNRIGSAILEVKASAARVEQVGRGSANILAYARAVEFLPIDMTISEREAFEKAMADEVSLFRRRLDQIEAGARGQVGRDDIARIKLLLARHEQEGARILQLSRSGAYDDAGKIAYSSSSMISEIRNIMRGIEERATSRQHDAEKTSFEVQSQATWLMLIVLIIGAIISLSLSAAMIIGFVTRPLAAMTDAMRKVAAGDATVPVPSLGQRDELGTLADALETFKVNLLESRRLAAQQEAERVAKERRADVVAGAVAQFELSVSEIVSAVASASSELEAAASTLSGTAETTQAKSAMVAAASEQASGNVQAVAAATNEMTSSINEISRQVQHSAEKARTAVSDVNATDQKVSQLLEAAGRIGDVVKLITAVAEQTNLLALNATIEAARAGEAGKGFAVVASEVKALAGQTAKATEAIGLQIAAMQIATEEAAASIQAIGATIVDVSNIAAAIAAAVEEQGTATQEISRNVQEAAKGTTEVASSISDVNQGAIETGSASSQVLSASQGLSKQGSRLKSQVDMFLETVRAA